MASGITTPALEYTKYSLSYINSIWTNNFIRLLQKHNIKIKMKENMLFHKQRYNDSCIMGYILYTTTSLTNITRLNACRLYLRISFLSEMSNIKGTAIITGSLSDEKIKIANSNFEWPNKSRPSKLTRSMWSRMITRLFYAQSNSNILRPSKRLGQWTTNHLQSTQQHKYLYSPSTKDICVR